MRKLGNHQIATSGEVKDLAGAPVTTDTVDERLMGLRGAMWEISCSSTQLLLQLALKRGTQCDC